MEWIPDNFWARLWWLTVGVAVGVFALLWLRVVYYEWMEFRPNMAPQIAYVFAPGIILVLVLLAGFFEAGFTKYWFPVRGRVPNIVVGISYASIVIALLGPVTAGAFIFTNPVVARWCIKRWSRNEKSAV